MKRTALDSWLRASSLTLPEFCAEVAKHLPRGDTVSPSYISRVRKAGTGLEVRTPPLAVAVAISAATGWEVQPDEIRLSRADRALWGSITEGDMPPPGVFA